MGNVASCLGGSAETKYNAPDLGSRTDVAIKGLSDQGAVSGPASHSDIKADVVKSEKPVVQVSSPTAFATTKAEEVAPELAPLSGLPYQIHYCGPPPPPCNEERLRTIKAINSITPVLDEELIEAPPDPEINNILKLVANIFQSPAALVALFDDRRIFVRDSEGAFKRGDFPWRWSFCGWTMASKNDQIMVIPDATKDLRFANNDFVKENIGGVRFYCGTPLIASNGHRLGTLCFADFKPREFDAASCQILNNLSELVVRHIEKDIALQLRQHDNTNLTKAYQQLHRTMDCFELAVALVDTSVSGWRLVYVNMAWSKLTGLQREDVLMQPLTKVLEALDGSSLLNMEQQEAVLACKEFQIQLAQLVQAQDGVKKKFKLGFRPASKEGLDTNVMPIGIPAGISATQGKGGLQNAASFYFMSLEEPKKPERKGSSTADKLHAWMQSTDMEGLTMGHLLGKGAYGSVYYGTWYGTPVAVKIVDPDVNLKVDPETNMPIEAVLCQELRHPHIVTTLKCMTRHVPVSDLSSTLSTIVSRSGFSDDTARTGNHSQLNSRMTSRANTNNNSRIHNSTAHAQASGANADSVCTLESAASNPGWAIMNLDNTDTNALEEEQDAEAEAAEWHSLHKNSGVVDSFDHGSNMYAFSGHGAPPSTLPKSGYDENWIVMEFCDRGSLQDAVDKGWLRNNRTLNSEANMEAVLSTAGELASALSFLHSRGIVHGDLSAWNVMLCSTGAGTAAGKRDFVAKITDFGLARCLDDVKSKIMTKTYGTLTHMPAEALKDGIISKATDVYSFGVLMWQMYTSSRPWAGLSHGQIIVMVVTQHAQLQFPAGCPEAYAKLAQACMAKNPADRPTFEAVVKELDAISADLLY